MALQLNEADKTMTVITRAIRKLSIQGSPEEYSLVQVLPDNSKDCGHRETIS